MLSRLAFVHAFTPLHAGIGQGAGVIDLPIAREKATGLPFLPGSSIKGALRTRLLQEIDARNERLQPYKDIFGSDPGGEDLQMRASSVVFSDQRVLLLPVRSIAGTFAWVTSPYVLHRFIRELAEVSLPEELPKDVPTISSYNACHLTQEGKATLAVNDKVFLEDFDLSAHHTHNVASWATWLGKYLFSRPDQSAWQSMFGERLCLVHDDLFHFMCQHSTEITARIKLEDYSKTVADGGLWYEEALPAETILSGIAVITPVKSIKLGDTDIASGLGELTRKTLQFGGKATVGRGMCQVQLV